jgi:hypothetical protein
LLGRALLILILSAKSPDKIMLIWCISSKLGRAVKQLGVSRGKTPRLVPFPARTHIPKCLCRKVNRRIAGRMRIIATLLLSPGPPHMDDFAFSVFDDKQAFSTTANDQFLVK